jgi:hypothetical protein
MSIVAVSLSGLSSDGIQPNDAFDRTAGSHSLADPVNADVRPHRRDEVLT